VALIDTGANTTAAKESVIQAASLPFAGFTSVQGAHGSSRDHPTFFGQILFPWGSVRNVGIVQLDLGNQGFDCIIGRDTMRNWIVIYDGISGVVTIAD